MNARFIEETRKKRKIWEIGIRRRGIRSPRFTDAAGHPSATQMLTLRMAL
jgi:hypothetical protein